MQDQGETNHQDQHWGKILFPHQQIHTTTYLNYFTDTETLSRWEKLWYAAHSIYTTDQLKLKVDDVDSYLPLHQYISRMSTSYCTLFYYKTCNLFPKLEHFFLRA